MVAAGEGEAWEEEATSGRGTHLSNGQTELDEAADGFPSSNEASFVSWASILERPASGGGEGESLRKWGQILAQKLLGGVKCTYVEVPPQPPPSPKAVLGVVCTRRMCR